MAGQLHGRGRASKLPIEHFDITRYNPQASIWENLLFGELPSDKAGGQILRSDYATAILDGMGLRAKFFDLGYEMAATILEFLGEGHEAILGESVVSLFFLIGSIPAMFWLNSMGRRPLLIRSPPPLGGQR